MFVNQLLLNIFTLKIIQKTYFLHVYRLEQDIGFANAAGFQSLAVLTGGAKFESFESHPRLDELPDYYLNSFADFSTILDELAAADIHH